MQEEKEGRAPGEQAGVEAVARDPSTPRALVDTPHRVGEGSGGGRYPGRSPRNCLGGRPRHRQPLQGPEGRPAGGEGAVPGVTVTAQHLLWRGCRG